MKINKTSFFKHQEEFEKSIVCNRSSAIFAIAYNKKKNINTQLIFLEYWSIKNKYNIPQCNLNLRNCDGKSVFKFSYLIKKSSSNVIDLKKLIPENILSNLSNEFSNFDFIGTIEVEFLSNFDLKVAYPAVICRYFSDNWHTSFHTSQRIMNKLSGDLFQKNQTQYINEGNMLLNFKKNIETILIITNGTQSIMSQKAELLVEGNNKSEKFEFELPPFKPYQIRILEITKIIGSRLDGWLKDSLYATVRFVLSNDIFPRMIYGLLDKKNGDLSLDHTNFGKSESSDLDVFKSSGGSYDLLYSLPSTPWIDVLTEIHLPPSYPQGNYELNIESLDFVYKENHCISFENKSKIDFQNKSLPCAISYENAILPRRFHTTFIYKVKKSDLYGFFTDGPLPRNSKLPGFRWAPFWVNENQSYIQIAPRSFSKNIKKNFDILIKLYSERGFHGEFFLKIPLSDDFIIDSNFLERNFDDIDKSLTLLWITFSYGKENNVPVFQYISRRKNSICVDHAF